MTAARVAGRAEPLAGHRRAQFVVLDQLAGAFHRRQQGRLGVARRRPGLQAGGLDLPRGHLLAGIDLDQGALLLHRLLAVDRQPARLDQHLAFVLNRCSPTVVMRVVSRYSADGKKTDRKRLTTRS